MKTTDILILTIFFVFNMEILKLDVAYKGNSDHFDAENATVSDTQSKNEN